MRTDRFSCFMPRFVVVSLALASMVMGMYASGGGTVHAAGVPPGYAVTIHPDYYYAGRFFEMPFACQDVTARAHCYTPAQMRRFYDMQSVLDRGITGKGRTIVILDAFQAPTIASDLKLFDVLFGLPDAPLNIIAPDGLPRFDPANAEQVGWSSEISLDVEWAHMAAPDATIDLVLARGSDYIHLGSALQYSVDHNLGDVISMSFGGNERCLVPALAAAWHTELFRATLKGITLLASSGDTGAAQHACNGSGYERAVSFPATDPLVTGVGGTQLMVDPATGEYRGEVAWNEPELTQGSGGGFSTLIRKPFYQYGVGAIGAFRGVPDLSYNAATNGGVLTVWSTGPAGPGAIYTFGGTSAGAPQWAGIVALANQLGQKRLGFINPAVYLLGHSAHYSAAFHDVTSGTNTITLAGAHGDAATIQGYRAERGWDAVTGWGSPRVSTLLPLLLDLVLTQDHTNGVVGLE